MGQPLKTPQLKGSLLWFTPVEILGEIFCGTLYNHCAENLITRGVNPPHRALVENSNSDNSLMPCLQSLLRIPNSRNPIPPAA